MFYLSVNTILIVLWYQCLVTYTLQFGTEREKWHTSSKSGCFLWPPSETHSQAPMALAPYLKEPRVICPDIAGRVAIKRNSSVKLWCRSSNFEVPALAEFQEIVATCRGEDSLEYRGKTYAVKDIKCQKSSNWYLNITEADDDCVSNTEENINDKINELNDDEIRDRHKLLNEYRESPDCFLFLSTGGRSNMPIPFTVTRNPSILRLRKDGVLTFKRHSYIKLSCTYQHFVTPSAVKNMNEVTIRCVNGSKVDYDGKVYEFDMFKCDSVPKPTLKITNKTCQGKAVNKVLEVGFQTDSAFLTLYKICFDTEVRIPLYSWYFVKAPHFQPYHKLFGMELKNFTHLYDIDPRRHYEIQRDTVENIIDSRALSQWYIKEDEKTTRKLVPGLLVPACSFAYPFEQYATYYFENSGPMWSIFNNGLWKYVAIELKLKMSHAKRRHMIIYGTYGNMMLIDVRKNAHPFFLKLPNEMPVPEYFWMMDYNQDKNDGIVYVGRNNPFHNMIYRMSICPAIPCPGNIIRREGYDKDFLYCCTKETFEFRYGKIDYQVYRNFV